MLRTESMHWYTMRLEFGITSMTQDEVIKSRDGKMTVTTAGTESDVESNDLVLEEKNRRSGHKISHRRNNGAAGRL